MKKLFLETLKTFVQSSSNGFLLLILCAIHISAKASPTLISEWILKFTDWLHITDHIEPISTICFYVLLLGILWSIVWYIKNDIDRTNCSYDTDEYWKIIESRVNRSTLDEKLQKVFLLLFFLDILNHPDLSVFMKLACHFNCSQSWILLVSIFLISIFQCVRENRAKKTY